MGAVLLAGRRRALEADRRRRNTGGVGRARPTKLSLQTITLSIRRIDQAAVAAVFTPPAMDDAMAASTSTLGGTRALGGTSSVFRSSIASRRFPALANLTADDMAVVVVEAPAARTEGGGSSRLLGPDTVKSGEVEALTRRRGGEPAAPAKPRPDRAAAAAAAANAKRLELPPFRPCNPQQARERLTVKSFVSVYSPYDMAHRKEMEARAASKAGMVGPAFIPTTGARGKEVAVVNYYLNSPDAETIAAEKELTRDRAAYNLNEFKRRIGERAHKAAT